MSVNARRLRVGLVTATVVLLLAAGTPSRATAAGGFDDFACSPSPDHPNPVVLIHGFGSPSGDSNFRVMGPELAASGYCAFAVTYGHTSPLEVFGGLAAMDESADFIRDYVERVRDATGAAQVDIVGHSEGGLHALYMPKKFDLGEEIGTVVALAPPTHGIELGGAADVLRGTGLPSLVIPVTDLFGCRACDELAISESFIHALNDGPIAQPGIDYTVIASRYDVIVHPTETSFVREPGVTNIEVQDVCPTDIVGHIGLAYDDAVFQMVTNALDPANATPIACGFGGPPF